MAYWFPRRRQKDCCPTLEEAAQCKRCTDRYKASKRHAEKGRQVPLQEGEAGTTPALGAITNAIADALKEYHVCDVEMPATSYKIWEAIKFASISK